MKKGKTTGAKTAPESTEKLALSFPFRALLILMPLLLVILGGGYVLYRAQTQAAHQLVENELTAIAQLKANEIARWRDDRLADADILVSTLDAERIAELLTAPDLEMTGNIRARLESMGKHYPYQDILIVAPQGKVLISTRNTSNLSEVVSSHLPLAFHERKAVLIDFYNLPGSENPRLEVIAPLFMPQKDGVGAVGAIVLSIDSSQFLDPLIQTWPVPSNTAETLLVRREGDSVLFLNELRHQKGTALKLKIPLSQQEVPAVVAALGRAGTFEGKDYRGIKVLAVVQPVADSPWVMIAKVDSAEAFAQARNSAALTLGLLSGPIVLIFVIGGLIWQRKQKISYQTLYNAEIEREKIEDILRHREAELSAVWSSMPLLIFILDRERRVVKANPAAEKFAGRCQSEMVSIMGGEALGCLHSLDDPKGCGYGPSCQNCSVRISVLDTLNTGISHNDLEWQLPFMCDGKPVEISFLFSTVLLTTPEKQVMMCIQDITELKKVGAALAESERKYRGLYESIKDGIVYTDMSGKFLSCNRAYADMLGYSEEELRDLTYQQLTPANWAAMEEEIVRTQIIQRGYSDPYEKEYIRKDGAAFPISIRAWLMKNEAGEGVGMWGIVRDITEQKRAEEAIKSLNEDLRRHSAELEASNKELEAFSYSVSHDLRAPLRSMTGFSHALIEDYNKKLDEQGKQYLRWIQESAELMSQLIDDLLQLSRVTRAEIHQAQIDITSLAKSVMDELTKAEPERQVEFTIAPGITCQGDSRLMRRVMENLLGNAWKFTRNVAMPKIEVGIIANNGNQVYFVRDNGVGFDMAYIDKLFKPFQRLHKVEEYPGTGIGLATVQRIISRHGGRVWAEGESGKGATFYFTLN